MDFKRRLYRFTCCRVFYTDRIGQLWIAERICGCKKEQPDER